MTVETLGETGLQIQVTGRAGETGVRRMGIATLGMAGGAGEPEPIVYGSLEILGGHHISGRVLLSLEEGRVGMAEEARFIIALGRAETRCRQARQAEPGGEKG
jgi:hypothetical protein